MKKLSGVFICLLLFTFISSARIIEVADAGITDKLKAVIARRNVAEEEPPACPSGTFAGGDTETFECGSAATQTYDNGTGAWAITGTLNTYDSADKINGSYSMSMDLGASAEAYIEADIGSGDSDWSVKFAWYAPTITQWTSMSIFAARQTSGDPSSTYACYIVYRYDATGPNLRVRNQADAYTNEVYITAGAWYWIQVDYNDGGNIELSVWNSAMTEDDDSPVTVEEAGTITGTFFYFGQYDDGGTDFAKHYFDDLQFSAAGGDI